MNDDFWQQIKVIRDEVNKKLEDARNAKSIGSSLQAEVAIYADEEKTKLLKVLGDELRFVLLVSKCELLPLSEAGDALPADVTGLALKVKVSSYKKCDRCWHYVADVGTIEGHGNICGRCVSNIDGDGEVRKFA